MVYYRSYRELYRRKTEIRTLGSGPGKIVLGRWFQLTTDSFVIMSISWVFPGFPIGWLLYHWIPRIPPFVWAAGVAFGLGVLLGRLDLQGKASWRWALDALSFVLRSKWHDGWRGLDWTDSPGWAARVYAVDQGTAYSTPVTGTGIVLRLHRQAQVHVKRGVWTIRRGPNGLAPGTYRIRDGRVVHDTAPKVKF